MNRRDFIKAIEVLPFLSLVSCRADSSGGSSNTEGSPAPTNKSILFGLGNDPAYLLGQDPNAAPVLQALSPNILALWINGAVDSSENVYSPSMSFINQLASQNLFKQWSDAGYKLMVISWENYNGQNPSLGIGQPTYGNYHISNQFIQDITTTVNILKSQFSNRVYFALAAEQSTYTACRYVTDCSQQQQYSDVINPTTEPYFQGLQNNLLTAFNIIKNSGLDALYSTCFGGWLVTFARGQRFIEFFNSLINSSNAIFFQSMIGLKSSENNGFGNPQQILANCQFFSKYNLPIHLAYYMPVNQRADVVTDDMNQMANLSYIENIYNLGLRSFSFMYYGMLEGNPYGDLTATQNFRNMIKSFT